MGARSPRARDVQVSAGGPPPCPDAAPPARAPPRRLGRGGHEPEREHPLAAV